MFPLLLLLAGAAMTAPIALAESSDHAALASANPETLGAYVREYFKDEPIMATIARCESRNRHLGKDGTILRGIVNKSDIGVMQINTYYHGKVAEKMDIDLYSLDGNLAYAKFLYEKEGTVPWNSSRPCWGKLAIR